MWVLVGLNIKEYVVLVQIWSLKTKKDILGRLNHAALPVLIRQVDTPIQRLRNELVDALAELNEIEDTHALER